MGQRNRRADQPFCPDRCPDRYRRGSTFGNRRLYYYPKVEIRDPTVWSTVRIEDRSFVLFFVTLF